MVNIGIIGCGWAGGRHAEACRSIRERIRVVAVADRDPDVARRFAETWEASAWYDDYRRLLAHDGLDAVSICTPHDLHAEMAIQAAGAGLYVLVEKPLATSLQDADAMIAAARESSVVLMVAETVRFVPEYVRTRELIERGYIGDIFLIEVTRKHEMHAYLRARPWFLQSGRAGGIMMSGGIHDFETMRMLGGEIHSVFARQAPKALPDMADDDTSVALVTFETGATGILVESFSTRVPEGGRKTVEVYGSRGSIEIGSGSGLTLISDRVNVEDQPVSVRMSGTGRETFVAEMAHFVDCIERDEEPITSGREMRKPLAAVLAAYESMATGRCVVLST